MKKYRVLDANYGEWFIRAKSAAAAIAEVKAELRAQNDRLIRSGSDYRVSDNVISCCVYGG